MNTHSVFIPALSICSVLMASFLENSVFAAEALDQIQVGADWEKVGDAELDSLRGGFTLPSGLVVDFSFDKRVYQNGIESFYSYFELPKNTELSRSRTEISDLASDFTNMVLNSVTQNRLDNQVIKTLNTISIDISNVKNAQFDINNAHTFRDLVSPTYK
ncbi:hypothetical protein [Neptunomonas japonica]|uniref:hypothetical protein n=1 Tax=Neptunomonas japonica TaxID=417574 RepID=UPI00040312DE|nr:hypothetical protein [Neptunomonas japonica]